MTCRVLVCVVVSVFFLLPSFAEQSLNNSETDAPSPSVTHSPATEGDISVVRLRVPGKAVGLYNRALDAFKKQKLEDAEKNVEKALKIYPSYPDALVLRGGIHLKLREWEAAERDFRASVNADPSFSSGYIVLADALNEEFRFDDALEVLQRADALAPGTWRVQYETSRALIGKHLYERALNVVEEALRARSAYDPLLRLAKAHALAALGKLPEAAKELRAYLSSRPENGEDAQARDLLNQVETASGGQ
jgi:predicted Zn-dependent protease